MKVAVFGASGLLGSAVCNSTIRRGYELLPYVHKNILKFKDGSEGVSLNLCNENKVTREIFDQWPDAIVNCGAISSPDQVEAAPKVSHKINVEGSCRLALLASHIGARFIHVSTDMVFDGNHSPYRSTDMPNPLNEYGIQKLRAEEQVLAVSEENIVVLRITLINGNSPNGNRSQHEKILRSLVSGKALTLFEDEIRQPCSAENVADVIIELLERPQLNGLFHWSGLEDISRYELGVKILDRFGINPDKIEKGNLEAAVSNLGPRPKHLSFILEPLSPKLRTQPSGIDRQLSELMVPNDLYSWYRNFADNPSKYIPKF